MRYYDFCENASDIIGCFCTLVLAYKGHREGRVVQDFGTSLIVELTNGREIEVSRDGIILDD